MPTTGPDDLHSAETKPGMDLPTYCPLMAKAMATLLGLTPLTQAELQSPFSAWRGLSDSDIRYWRPRTLGDALFNRGD